MRISQYWSDCPPLHDLIAQWRLVSGQSWWMLDRQESDVEAYELPTFAKVLVVAAYVAARTRETMDRASFDPTARRKRRKQNLAHDKQVRHPLR